MSFYFEHDDESVAPEGADAFLCPNCGGTESYTDDGGNMFCSLCFSQSQTQTNEGEFDYDEIEAHIGRGSRGQVLGITYLKRSKGDGRRSWRKPNETFDKSKPLPSLEECLRTYTTIIKVCIERVCNIIQLNKDQTQVLQTAVRSIWLNYLHYWQEGADFYNKHHEGLHLTMRTQFFGGVYNALLARYLYHQAKEFLKKQKAQNNNDDDDDDSDDSDDDQDDNNNNNHDDNDKNDNHQSDEKVKDKRTFAASVLILVSEMYPHRKGRHEAALHVCPNMESVASFLLTAFCRLGVTARHLVVWIANGKVPLLNAYNECLSPEQQSKVQVIKQAFCLDKIVWARNVEFKAKLLLAAAGREPTLIPPESIPLLLRRLVIDDLHLDERVLNLALALLGKKQQPKDATKENWLPLPLEQLQTINNQIQILAVIAVACKLTPGWEFRKLLGDKAAIPWTDREAMYTEIPIASYADFVERHILASRQEDDAPSFVPDFLKDVGHKQGHVPSELQESEKSSHMVLTGEPNPNMPRRRNLQNLHEWNLIVRNRKAVWVDANGFGRYVVYAQKRVPLLSTHPHYQALIEYIAHVTDTRAQSIHKQVMDLDHELHLRWTEVRYPRRVKRKERQKHYVPVAGLNDNASATISSSIPKSATSSVTSRDVRSDSDSDDDRSTRHARKKKKKSTDSSKHGSSRSSSSTGEGSSSSRSSPSDSKSYGKQKASSSVGDNSSSAAQNDPSSGSDTERSMNSQDDDDDRVPGSQAIF